jgi:hypothetical protein
MITLETIKALKPCKDRLDNYVKHYSEKSFTHGQFMGLKNITQEDKIWVALRLIPQAKLRFAAADIAESVLDIYEAKYPNDNRPRLAIEAARNGSECCIFKRNNPIYQSRSWAGLFIFGKYPLTTSRN